MRIQVTIDNFPTVLTPCCVYVCEKSTFVLILEYDKYEVYVFDIPCAMDKLHELAKEGNLDLSIYKTAWIDKEEQEGREREITLYQNRER